jgi:hypothetical protein
MTLLKIKDNKAKGICQIKLKSFIGQKYWAA